MAIDFTKMLEEARAEAGLSRKKTKSTPVVSSQATRQSIGIRFCGQQEVVNWVQNRTFMQQGAGYSLMNEGLNLRTRLVASIDGAKALGSTRLLVLKDCPLGTAERYNFRLGRTLKKINAICNGQSTMVSWMDITGMTNDETADLVLAVIDNADIINA